MAGLRLAVLSGFKSRVQPCMSISLPCQRHYSQNNSPIVAVNHKSAVWDNPQVVYAMNAYEDFIGLTEVKLAQEKVLQAESKFLETQIERREKQLQLNVTKRKLKDLSSEIDKVKRGEEKFITLLQQEHVIIQEENALSDEIQKVEELERTYFSQLSSAVRESHEKERARAERTKYWSAFGSILGVIFGFCGSMIVNSSRMSTLRQMGQEQANKIELFRESMDKFNDKMIILNTLLGQLATGKSNVETSDDVKAKADFNNVTDPVADISKDIQLLVGDLANVKENIANLKLVDSNNQLVVLDSGVKECLQATETHIEGKLKMYYLYSVAAMCGTVSIATAVLYTIFKGS